MCPFYIPFFPAKKKKSAHPIKVIAIVLAVGAACSAVAYAAVKLYRKFCIIDKVDKDAIDNGEPLAEEESTEEDADASDANPEKPADAE